MQQYLDSFNQPLVPKDFYIKITDKDHFHPQFCIIQLLDIVEIKGRDYFNYITIYNIKNNKNVVGKQLFHTVYNTKKVTFIPISEDTFKDYLTKI